MIVGFSNSQDKRAEPRYPALTAPARPRNRAREKGANQLHCARVLEVRIHLPPADSPSLAGFLLSASRTPQLPRDARAPARRQAGRDAQGSSTSRQLPVISL